MRTVVLSAAVLLSSTVLMADSLQPLSVKPGLWQVTMTNKIDLLPAPTTTTYQSCVKSEDLNKYPFSDPKENCTWTVLSSTGRTMEATGTCTPPRMGTIQFKLRLEAIDSENVRGTGQVSLNGPQGALNGMYSGSGKWMGATCPAGMR